MKVKEKVFELSTKIAEELNFRIIDVDYSKKHDGMNLTVFIDKLGGITLEDTTAFAEKLNPILDELDLIDGVYTFNVSSPGLDRKFKNKLDYVYAKGKKVETTLFTPIEKTKKIVGTLVDVLDDKILIELNKKTIEIEFKNIASTSFHIEF